MIESSMTDVKHKSDSGGELVPGNRRDVRRLAMQVLYQLDVTNPPDVVDRQALLDGLDAEFDKRAVREQGVDLALGAWARHKEADREVELLTPEWPTHRQPPVDRAILRLAYYEIKAHVTPVKVAINEAIELAKHYAGEQSPAFVNGVLDKLAKSVGHGDTDEAAPPAEAGSPDAQAWLEDAKKENE